MALTPFFGEIYVHTNVLNGKSYVGQTTAGMLARWKDHVKHSRLPKHAGFRYPFARAIRKYGPEAFEHQILSIARTKVELDNLERIWIILLQTREIGYNITAGGDGNLGLRHGATALAKMSEAKLGNKHCVGRQVSDETRVKLGSGNRGKKRGPYSIERMAAARAARWIKTAEVQHGA